MTDARLPGSGRRRRPTARLAAGVAVLSLGLAGVTAARAAEAAVPSPVPPVSPDAARADLLRAAGGNADLTTDPAGRVQAVTARPGASLARAVPGASTETVAGAFAGRYAAAFGGGWSGSTLARAHTSALPGGDRVVRFGQQAAGTPVLGADLSVVVRGGAVTAAVGKLAATAPQTTTARVPVASARATAVAAAVKRSGLPAGRVRVRAATLWQFSPTLLGGPAGVPLRATWRVELAGAGPGELAATALVDATDGVLRLYLDEQRTAQNRRTCDFANAAVDLNTPAAYACTAGRASRTEGQAATGNVDVDRAHDYAGDTYQFYFTRFGRDSLNGAGLPLLSSVRVCDLGGCPFQNAFWDGSQMVYGAGFAAADDVVGHELSHGVTQYTSNLFYAFQSGAINESMSDIFGELIDLSNARGTDTAAVRWKLGEDMPIGAIRDMRTPSLFQQPDRMTSPLYELDGFFLDQGGVHTNSGVGNKAAFLMTDGGTFNGRTVTALGIDKVAQIYYRTQNLLASGSDYADLAAALRSACTQLATAGTAGITTANCTQVGNAIAAVEMTRSPVTPGAEAKDATVCPAGQKATNLYSTSFETAGGWTFTNGWVRANSIGGSPYAHTGKWTIATNTLDTGVSRTGLATKSTGVALPAARKAFLWFAHEDEFEAGADGGQVQYSTDNGATWKLLPTAGTALPRFVQNGYNGTLAAGQPAFTTVSWGYVSSRADLGGLQGKTVRFRFVNIGDPFVVSLWQVDDVRIYTCA